MDKSVLESIGLTKSEVSAYLALLELGKSTSGKIVDKSGGSSSKIYEILDRLIKKGLVGYVIERGVKHFEASSPESILDYMEEKKRTLALQENSLKTILPDLKLKQELSRYKAEATIFKGHKGLHSAFFGGLEKLKEGDKILTTNVPKRSKQTNRFFTKFVNACSERKIFFKCIFNISAKDDAQAQIAQPYFETKFMPETTPAAINILGERVIIFPSEVEEPLLIVIDNKDIAESFKTQFYKEWNSKVTTYEGKDEIIDLFMNLHEQGDYDCFAEGMKIVNVLGEKNFIDWQNKKKKFNVKSRVVMGERYRNDITVTKAHAEFKLIPGYENPGATLIFKDKVLNVILSDNPAAFMIESKDVAENNRTYFELFWNQDTTIRKGFDALWDMLVDFQGNADSSGGKVLGAAISENANRGKYEKLFDKLTKYRRQNNKKVKLLFEQTGKKSIEKYSDNYVAPFEEVKFMPYKSESPVEIYPDKKQVHLVVQDDEPTIITINNEKVSKAFENQFDLLWNQETRVLTGLDAVEEMFETFLKDGQGDFIGARGYFIDFRPEYIDDWERRAKKSSFKMRNICDPGVKGHRITGFDFVETKYTLPKEFSSSSVIWVAKEKVAISNWTETEPIVIIIENKKIVDMYRKQFDSLWNQTNVTYEGKKGIEVFFDQLLHYKDIWFIGGNFGMKEAVPKYWDEYKKKRIEHNSFWHDLLDEGTEGLESLKSQPHYECKTLPKEFQSPHVICFTKDFVAHIVWAKEKTAIFVMHNTDLVKSNKQHFDYLWKLAK